MTNYLAKKQSFSRIRWPTQDSGLQFRGELSTFAAECSLRTVGPQQNRLLKWSDKGPLFFLVLYNSALTPLYKGLYISPQ